MAWTAARYFPSWALLICVTSVWTRAEYSIILILRKLQKQHSVFPKVLPPGFWFSARTCKNGSLPDSLWAEMASKGISEYGHLRSPSPIFLWWLQRNFLEIQDAICAHRSSRDASCRASHWLLINHQISSVCSVKSCVFGKKKKKSNLSSDLFAAANSLLCLHTSYS